MYFHLGLKQNKGMLKPQGPQQPLTGCSLRGDLLHGGEFLPEVEAEP